MSEKEFRNTLNLLRKASSVSEVEIALNSIKIPEKDETGQHSAQFLSIRQPLKDQLESLLKKEGVTNKVLRRRISRFLHILTDGKSDGTTVSNGDGKQASGTSSTPTAPTAVSTPKIELSHFVSVLTSVTTPEELDKSLSGFSVESVSVSDTHIPRVIQQLEELSNNEQLVKNAKIRRKVNRTIEQLKNLSGVPSDKKPAATVASGKGASTAKKADATVPVAPAPIVKAVFNPPAGPPLDGVIEKVRICEDLDELDVLVSDVKPNSGSATSRRTLKRLLDRKLAEKDTQMNAKQRRKFKRVLQILEAKPGSGVKYETLENTNSSSGDDSTSAGGKRKRSSASAGSESGARIPYIVFIGQLSYETTQEDIEAHLRKHGIEGPVTVRLLTTPETGQCKGMAFVEVEGARELHKCIALHHSVLKGRRINVEKSCGGSNRDARADRLRQKRDEQESKVRETIDRMLQEYEDRGVVHVESLELRVKYQLHNYTPSMVRQILEKFAALDAEERNDNELGRIIYLANRSAKRVDRNDGHDEGDSDGDEDEEAHEEGFEGFGGEPETRRNDESMHRESSKGTSRRQGRQKDCDASIEEDGVPWGYSTRPMSGLDGEHASSSIADVFPSVRGRGGKILGSSRN